MSLPDRVQKAPALAGAFRPFFFLAALQMALSVLAWLPLYMGHIGLPTAFAFRDWHVHEMLFGGVPAVIAGFTLTAVPNWTGRRPIVGLPLLGLVVVWLAGRLAVATSVLTGAVPTAAVDLAFPLLLAAVLAREVVLAGNYRNLRVAGLILLIGLANLCFHVEAFRTGLADHAIRGGLSAVLMLILLMGGRIIPAFTRNWLRGQGARQVPAGFDRVDAAAMVLSALAFVAWTLLPTERLTGVLMALAGVATVYRLSRWCGPATVKEPLLLVLHVAFVTLPLGFLIEALAILSPDSMDSAAAVHVWTAGSVGTMLLAVMTRVSRGHGGKLLTAGWRELLIYGTVLTGALLRVAAPFAGDMAIHIIGCGGVLWALAFLLFAGFYGRLLLGPVSLSRP